MSDFVNTTDILGDGAVADSLIDRSITEYADNGVVTVGAYAFYKCAQLERVDLPMADTVKQAAFQKCVLLSEMNAPAIRTVEVAAFSGCKALKSLLCPELQTVGDEAFSDCSALASFDFSAVTRIPNYAFRGCNFTEVNAPQLVTLGTAAFTGCKALKKVIMPKLPLISSSPFSSCTALELADFAALTKLQGAVFSGCTAIKTLILRADTVCYLLSASYMNYGGFADGTGHIYVPAVLLDSYKADTNWSTYAGQFRALEDYTVDGTTTGELDETKI